jgi:head-tail adaptor
MGNLRRLNDSFAYTPLGAYRDQITLLAQSSDVATDGSPAPMVAFATNVWANIRQIKTPQEVDTTELVQGEAWYQVRIPYMQGVSSNVDGVQLASGKIWLVVATVDPDRRMRELWMTCRCVNDGVVDTTPVNNQIYVPASSGQFDIDDGTFGPGAEGPSWEFGSGE